MMILGIYGAMYVSMLDFDDNGDNDDNYDDDDDDTGGHMEQCVRACRTLVSRCSARFMQSYYLLGLHSLIMMIIIHMMMIIVIKIQMMMMMMLTVITLWDTCQGLDLCEAITFSTFILLIMMIILVTLLLNNDNDDNSRNNDNNNDDNSRNSIFEQR